MTGGGRWYAAGTDGKQIGLLVGAAAILAVVLLSAAMVAWLPDHPAVLLLVGAYNALILIAAKVAR